MVKDRKTLIYWRDIPSQVIVQHGRRREKVMLSARFQQAIDRAAMRAGKGSSNLYLAEWRREASPIDMDADPKMVAESEARRIESEYPDERLAALIRSQGIAGQTQQPPAGGHPVEEST